MCACNCCWRCGQQSHVHTECTVPRKDLPDGRDESNRASLGVFGSSLPLLSSRVSPQTPELCTSQSVPVTLIGRRRPALRWTQSLVRYHHQIPTALTAERRFAEKSSKRPMSERLSYAVKTPTEYATHKTRSPRWKEPWTPWMQRKATSFAAIFPPAHEDRRADAAKKRQSCAHHTRAMDQVSERTRARQ